MALSIEDRLEIQELLARYAHATDTIDAAARADTFTSDGVFDPTGPALHGHGEILRARRPSNAADLRHLVSNTVVEGDGDVAHAVSYLTVIDTGASRDQPATIWVTGVYYDTLRKVDGKWRFAYRNFVRDDLRNDDTIGHRL